MLRGKKLIVLVTLLIAGAVACLAVYLFLQNSTEKPTSAQPLDHHQRHEVEAKLAQLLEEGSPKASLDYLRTAIKEDTALARECHPLLHHVGRSAYAKYNNFGEAIQYQDGLCNSGYTHGVIEAHFIASENIEETLQATCPSLNEKITFELWQCYHGMGHGAMYVTGKSESKSIALCEKLSTDFARRSCVNGVYMERFIIVSHTGEQAQDTTDASVTLCKTQPAEYKADCYFYAPTAYLERHTNDYKGAFDECRSVETDYAGTCINGVGGQAMKENVTHPEVARNVCKQAPHSYKNSCLDGALSLLINHYGSTEPAEAYCTTVFASYKEACQEKIRSWKVYFNA